MLSARHGFTLIELLIVIGIMAITSVFALANYRSFGEDQNLKNAVLDVISLFRQAQANATTNVICSGGSWQVEFTNATTINLKCSSIPDPLRPPLRLETKNIRVQSVSGSGSSCPTAPPFTISFGLLTGKVNLGGTNCDSLTITLINSKGITRSLVIEQGGQIHEQ